MSRCRHRGSSNVITTETVTQKSATSDRDDSHFDSQPYRQRSMERRVQYEDSQPRSDDMSVEFSRRSHHRSRDDFENGDSDGYVRVQRR